MLYQTRNLTNPECTDTKTYKQAGGKGGKKDQNNSIKGSKQQNLLNVRM